MTLANTLKQMRKQGQAIGQFNFSAYEQLNGIVLAANKLNTPVILGTSEREAKFLDFKIAVGLKSIFQKRYNVPIFIHLDHGRSLAHIKEALDAGYDSIHFDGSGLSFEKNIALTKKIVDIAHKKHVFVEGELGYLRGKSGFFPKQKTDIAKQDLTRPEQVEEFTKKTKVDSLAIAIGNIHGIYAKAPLLDFERLEEIRDISNVFLVLHGGSGISAKNLRTAIRLGVQKININTEIRILWKEKIMKSVKNTKEIKPYLILPEAIKAIQDRVEKYIKIFNNQK